MAEERVRVLGFPVDARWGTALTVLLMLLVVALVAGTWFFKDMVPGLRSLGYLGMFLIGIVGSASIFILPTPTMATICAGGTPLLDLNPLAVGLVAGLGGGLGEMVAYAVGLGSQTAIRKGRLYLRVHQWVQHRGGPALLLLAFVPNPIFDIAGVAAGALRFPMPQFLLWVCAGKILRATAIAVGCSVGASWIPSFL